MQDCNSLHKTLTRCQEKWRVVHTPRAYCLIPRSQSSPSIEGMSLLKVKFAERVQNAIDRMVAVIALWY
jgi:hypothetical protein